MDLQRVCHNHSFAEVRCLPAIDRRGFDVAVAVAKLTFEVDASGAPRLRQSKIHFDDVADDHRGLRYPHDTAEEKLGTDVALVGTAQPRGRVTPMAVWLQVGGYRKVTVVHGRRRYERKGSGIVPGPADALEPTPVVHALAWGGTDGRVPERTSEPKNPIGRGFAVDPLTLVGEPAHVLEPSGESTLVTNQASHPCHAAFAPIPLDWEPRRSLAGTHDLTWQNERAPVRPLDFDPMFNSFAVPDLHFKQPLTSDVPIEVGGMTPEGVWRFRLPSYGVTFASAFGGERVELPTHLDSLLIDADRRRVELSWRAAVRLPRKWDRLRRIDVWGTSSLADELFDETYREEISA